MSDYKQKNELIESDITGYIYKYRRIAIRTITVKTRETILIILL